LAEKTLHRHAGDVEAAIGEIVQWQVGQAGLTGFATNLGGLITLPVALPANLAAVLLLQLRMVIAIAVLRGYDPADERVKTLCLATLVGNGFSSLLKDVGVQVGTRLTRRMIERIPGVVLSRINRAVGFRLMTKAGTTGAVNLVRVLPFVGGLVCGLLDAGTTQAIAHAARQAFPASSRQAEEDGQAADGAQPAAAPA
jgi:hypothetical protein